MNICSCGRGIENIYSSKCIDCCRPKPTLDLSKPIQTRAGKPARLYAQDGRGNKIHAAYLSEDGWAQSTWNQGGGYFLGVESNIDLINVPSPAPVPFRFERWVNIYQLGDGTLYPGESIYNTEKDAQNWSAAVKTLKLIIEGELCP